MRHFAKGFLIGILCICLLGLVWLFAFQPRLTAKEAQDLKAQFTTIPEDDLSGDGPAGKEEPQLDFETLQARYPDVKGWLTIPGTVVDYPVLQSSAEDPEKYLRRNYDMKWRMAGSLFFQNDCTPDSRNLVIFGHNMNDGTMFAVLKKMTDPAVPSPSRCTPGYSPRSRSEHAHPVQRNRLRRTHCPCPPQPVPQSGP